MHAARWPTICDLTNHYDRDDHNDDGTIPDAHSSHEPGSGGDAAAGRVPGGGDAAAAAGPRVYRHQFATPCVCHHFVKTIGTEWGLALQKRKCIVEGVDYGDQRDARKRNLELRKKRQAALDSFVRSERLVSAAVSTVTLIIDAAYAMYGRDFKADSDDSDGSRNPRHRFDKFVRMEDRSVGRFELGWVG
jgi:hypothetical protein